MNQINKIIEHPKFIKEIIQENPGSEKRIALQSINSKKREAHTFFIPWFSYIKEGKEIWVGVCRWKGNNKKRSIIGERLNSNKIWTIYKNPFPILPVTHPDRKILEKLLALANHKKEKYGN